MIRYSEVLLSHLGLEFYKNINHFIFMKTKIKGNERQVELGMFEKYFANEPILETYVLALEIPLTTYLLHAIIKMIHRILFNQDMTPLIFKMKYLITLQKAITTPMDVNDGERNSLIQLASKIGNLIKRDLKDNPKHVIEFYCTKTKSDIQRIKGQVKTQENGNGEDILVDDIPEIVQDAARIRIVPCIKEFKVDLGSPSLPVLPIEE
eukprot:NODE_285_length_11794_cov_0.197178.p6 type:complete len:208 gc:universal NODE_285_length_11794_cov_0.197178:1952-2575(+)